MALQICPMCGAKGITWTVDSDCSPFTSWSCVVCNYHAEEDEAAEADCPRCGSSRSSLLIRDLEGFRRWCCACGRFERTMESFGG